MSGPDVLFALRNNFYLGAFQAAINESNVRNLSDADAVEKDVFVYRSYIALGQNQVTLGSEHWLSMLEETDSTVSALEVWGLGRTFICESEQIRNGARRLCDLGEWQKGQLLLNDYRSDSCKILLLRVPFSSVLS